MKSTLDLVRDFSDSEVVEVTKELFNAVYDEIPYNDVRNNAEAGSEVGSLISLDAAVLKQDLSTTDSVRLGRLVLEQYALDPELELFVKQAWDKVDKSDDLVVGVILALGLVVNLTLLVATTKVSVEKRPDGKVLWKAVKTEADADLVKAVVQPVVEVARSTVA